MRWAIVINEHFLSDALRFDPCFLKSNLNQDLTLELSHSIHTSITTTTNVTDFSSVEKRYSGGLKDRAYQNHFVATDSD